MKVVALVMTSLVVALAASTLSVASGHQAPGEMDRVPGGITDQRVESPRREERIFAYYTTTSIKRLATTTITAISTCVSVSNGATACNGRRKRSVFRELENLELLTPKLAKSLDGSLTEELVDTAGGVSDFREVKNRQGKKLTVWTSNISTLTLTSTSYLAGTTITATAFCIAGAITANTCFG